MQNRLAINLSLEQTEKIKAAILKGNQRFAELQWQESEELEKLNLLLKEAKPDEMATLNQLAALNAVELEIKKEKLKVLIVLKSELTVGQINKLRELARGDDRRGRRTASGTGRQRKCSKT